MKFLTKLGIADRLLRSMSIMQCGRRCVFIYLKMYLENKMCWKSGQRCSTPMLAIMAIIKASKFSVVCMFAKQTVISCRMVKQLNSIDYFTQIPVYMSFYYWHCFCYRFSVTNGGISLCRENPFWEVSSFSSCMSNLIEGDWKLDDRY